MLVSRISEKRGGACSLFLHATCALAGLRGALGVLHQTISRFQFRNEI
jgi:hypothetical protein